MVRTRSPSFNRSEGCTRGLRSGDSSEYRADRHSQAPEIALAQDISRHDFTGRVHVFHALDLRLFVHYYAEVRECDAGAERIGKIWRRIDLLRPMCLVDRESARAAVVQVREVERAGNHGGVVVFDCCSESAGLKAEPFGKLT